MSNTSICLINYCVNNGLCFTNGTTEECVCHRCTTGQHCEVKYNYLALSWAPTMSTDIAHTQSKHEQFNLKFSYVFIVSCMV
ncbi:unnamed protein product, partial [Didymodactylos carnosus]